RVQIPGEKDPMKVIDNMLRPAQLQFRMVHAENDSRVGKLVEERVEDGQTIRTVKTADVPPGYRVFFGKITRPDPGRPGTKITETIPYLLSDDVPLDGKNLKENYVQIVQSDLESPIHINLVFDRKGSSTFKELTEKNVGRQLAILLDNEVYTAPRIKDPIPDGRCYISGSFDMEEARLINQVLKAGSMPARLQVEHKQTVGASLGTDTIRSSVKVLIVGAALVIAFMIVYYGAAGLIADIALIINVLMILAVLSMARAALTLSGIGGILLTIGMAVDANVLIYERIREEVSDGKPVKVAVKRGFDRAFTVIWDSNFTTLITALILLQFATGSVKGFALTMAIGLLVNLYTGLNVTHTLTDMWVTWRNHISLGALKIFRNTKFNFISARYGAYILSGVLLVAGIGALIVNGGPHYGVDFEGGILAQVQFREKVGGDDIRAAFSGMGMNIPRVQRVTGTEEFLLRIKMQDNDGAKTQSMMEDVLQKKFGAASYEIRSVQQVGNEIGEEFRWIALKSVLIASLAILIYVGFRFQFVFGMGAVIALLHDVLVVIGLLTIFGRDITLDVVSAILMIIGYSINDTIVIFDRIRENMRSVTGSTFKEIANLSINQSMSRTFLTSATTFFPMFIMFFFGGKGLADFALTICMGVIVGTYSSSFVATPLVYEWIKRKGFHAVEEKSTKTHFRTVDPLANQ
ncbi:MAG TPA: protein translocase subunit SecD, partial [Candidatus Sumerlaeota bacterium]|nr:protein translocase subunit SecD [Candidatus Sumerlaeota bacterium]